MKVLFVLLTLLLAGSLFGENALDSYLNDVAHRWVVPGFSVIVVDRKHTLYSRGFGVETAGFPQPMTPNTSSAIGSLTKSFTAACILQLQEKGLLNIDDPVIRYLPEFRTANKAESDTITIKMLMSNSSGIPSVDALIVVFDNSPYGDRFVEKSLSGQTLSFKPGTAFEYSNEGFVLLGLIIQKLSGQTYADYLADHLLRPLQMTRSTADYQKLRPLGALFGHRPGPYGPVPVETTNLAVSYAAAGSTLTASVVDLGHYLQMLLNKGVYQGTRVLSESSVALLQTPVIRNLGLSRDYGGEGGFDQYCLGWFQMEEGGRTLIQHGGNTGTMSSMTIMDPQSGRGVSLLMNFGPTDPFAGTTAMTVALNVLHLSLGEPLTSFGVPRIPDPFVHTWQLPADRLSAYEGTFVSKTNASNWAKTYVDANKKLIVEFHLSGRLTQSGWLDFLTPVSVALRSNTATARGSFGLDSQDHVASFTTLGDTMLRVDPTLPSPRVAADLGLRLSATLPDGWTAQGVDAQRNWRLSGKGATVSISVGAPAPLASRVSLPLTQLVSGTEHRENLGHLAWVDQSFAGETSVTVFAASVGDKELTVVVTAPGPALSTVLRRDVVPLLQSLNLE